MSALLWLNWRSEQKEVSYTSPCCPRATPVLAVRDLLKANAAGIAVLLTEHSNSERGFLRVVKETLEEKLREA